MPTHVKSSTRSPAATLPAVKRPAKAKVDVPVVGLGASAGGLAAFQDFFSGIPAGSTPGRAFVLVQHLAPDRHSLLAELIQRCTTLPVREITDGLKIAPNGVYIAPPGQTVALKDNTLRLLKTKAARGLRLPIDDFFRSLALARREHAIGIVLSGTGGDGTAGITAIKASHGRVFAQDPATCEFDGMPRSAIATGLVDFQGPAGAMAAQLGAASPAKALQPDDTTPASGIDPETLRKINALVSARTGHDFSLYKPGTLQRRIRHRMALNRIDRLPDYLRYLEDSAAEVDTLFGDFLIGVTQFFRDPAVFKQVERRVIPKLLPAHAHGKKVRVWVPGCSTGEEAYTLGILLLERLSDLNASVSIQIFATDIDPTAIAKARTGVYPAGIARDVSPQRLARYFTPEPGGSYRIQKAVRDLVIFSEQDINRDPPFSQLDLISCRNLFIYLSGELQQKLMPLFHYALKPDGILLLGSSEGTGEATGLFSPLDRKAKLYRRLAPAVPGGGMSRHRLTLQPIRPHLLARPGSGQPSPGAATLPLRELTERLLLRQFTPAGVLVNREGDILYIHGHTGLFLEPVAGAAETNNVLKMARAGLRRELTTALRTAARTGRTVRCPNLRVKSDGQASSVNLSVQPVALDRNAPSETQGYLVVWETAVPPPAAPTAARPGRGATTRRLAELQEELRTKEDFLQSANDELQHSTERLQSSNEEMQSVNEELQSTNEELETSKEELQSLNEEMATVNTELQSRVTDLTRANNDMNNLLAGTGIATVFLDRELRVMRFTPSAADIINLIPSDLGRPIAHLVANLAGYDRLVADAQHVLDTLEPKRLEVVTHAGAWYEMQLQPYRTADNTIEGIVVTFVDIAEIVKTREGLRRANDLLRLAVVVRDSRDALTVHDLSGRMLAWNPGAVALYGWTEAEALGLNLRERIPPAEQAEESRRIARLCAGELVEPYTGYRLHKSGTPLEVTITMSALLESSGKISAVAATERPKSTTATAATPP